MHFRRTRHVTLACATVFAVALLFVVPALAADRWSAEKANRWWQDQPWLVGVNYIPSSAVNTFEMWQADTFDPKRIDLELTWAESLGINTVRVFLHDQAWNQDPAGFKRRLGEFLSICEKHKIKATLVLFDSVFDPNPVPGKQREPVPGVHNSRWVQAPGAKALADMTQYPRLQNYIKHVVGSFHKDDRILAWDIWNEPDNPNEGTFAKDEPANKTELVLAILPQIFSWARKAKPQQPLTTGIWTGDWSGDGKMTPMQATQVELSDVVSFHNYGNASEFETRVNWLERFKRPILCTEYMARGNGSTFLTHLPVGKKHKVAMYSVGLAGGKTQTNLPWDSWSKPYVGDRQPTIWFHDIFYEDGKPYIEEEVLYLKRVLHE